MPKNNSKNQKPNTQPIRQFDAWNKVKKGVQKRARVPYIKEGEVWWFADGQNIGVEIDGKGDKFARPIVVLTKFGKLSFFGIPLTSKKHEGPWYTEYDFNGRTQYAALCQARSISVHRLYRKMGEMSDSDLQRVRTAFLTLHDKKYPLSSDRGGAGSPEDTPIIHRLLNKFKTFFGNFLEKSGNHRQN